MARMIAEVYDALKSVGAPEDQARAAATAVAWQQEIDAKLDRSKLVSTGSKHASTGSNSESLRWKAIWRC